MGTYFGITQTAVKLKAVIKEKTHRAEPINKNESHKTKNPNTVENEIEEISRILFNFFDT